MTGSNNVIPTNEPLLFSPVLELDTYANAVIPAKAGIYRAAVDSRFRGNDIGPHNKHDGEPK